MPQSDPAAGPQSHQVIAIPAEIARWIEPWYGAYAILGVLASGFAVIAIPLVVTGAGGTASQIGAAIAAQNAGVIFAPLWGVGADRSRAYRAIFFSGFVLIGAGFLGFSVIGGTLPWITSAFLVGLGTGASNTVASLFVVEFSAKEEWGPRISWLQTFNALGSVLGMALAGLLRPQESTLAAACLVVPALVIGGRGLPVPGGPLHMPQLRSLLTGSEWRRLVRHAGPNAHAMLGHLHRPGFVRPSVLIKSLSSPFGLFLTSWFVFSLAVSAFGALYPVLMRQSFAMDPARSSMLLSIATAVSIPLYNMAGRFATRRGPVTALAAGTAARMLALLGLGIVALLRPGDALLPAILLAGLYQGIWPLISVASNELAAGLSPISEGAAMGLFSATAAVASACGALFGGVIADSLGYAAVSLFAAAGVLLALLCTARLRRPTDRTAPDDVAAAENR